MADRSNGRLERPAMSAGEMIGFAVALAIAGCAGAFAACLPLLLGNFGP